MQARLAQIEETHQMEAAEAQRRESEALAKKGELESALQQLRKQSEDAVQAEKVKLSQIEERAKRYALDGELSRTLAAQPLVPHAAEQLGALWRSQFTVDAQGDSFTVRTPTFQSVGDYVNQQLARPEYAHFVRPGTQGGTAGGQGGHQVPPTTPAHPAAPPQPKNMGEAVILHMQGLKQAEGDPRLDPALGFGLRRAAGK
jgi:hypothetical protein